MRKNKIFTRKGADLYIDKEISLLDSLTGVDFTIMHLDGRIVRVTNPKGQVVKPDDMFTVEGLGMPFHKTNYKNGNLFVKFSIKFPESVDLKQIAEIKDVLKDQRNTKA